MLRVSGLVVVLFIMTSPLVAQVLRSELTEFVDDRSALHVIAVLDPECPISQKYTRPLNELIKTHASKRLKVYGVVAVRNIQQTEIDTFISHYQLLFPCVPDDKLQIAASLNAAVTPEVFLLDQDLNVIYSGAIDDWFFDLGRSKRKATTHFLENAIENHLTGKEVEIKRTEPIGCRISYQKVREQ